MTNNKIAEYDYIKGIAILSVILLHTVSYQFLYDSYAFFHIWQAVPLFIIVSYILIFLKLNKKENLREYYSIHSVRKVIKRIILPYILFQNLIFILDFLRYGAWNIYGLILGSGPGAYYPFIYIQLWVTTPFLFYLLNKLKRGGVILLTLCLLLNIITSTYLQNDAIYSRLLIRYLFISYLAFLWIKRRYKWSLFLSILSIAYYFATIDFNLKFEPIIDNRWSLQQLPCYFYTLCFFVICYKLYPSINRNFQKVTIFLEWCGQNSYEIFLLQMFFLNYLSYELFGFTSLIPNYMGCLGRIFYILIILTLSILPIPIYQRVKKRFIK